MWLSLLLVVLLIAVALYQSIHGFFSAMLMMVLTVLCAVFSVGTFQYVAEQWLAPNWKPDYALALALGGMFGVSLLVLRIIMDKAIPRAPLLPAMVDRVGSVACGFVTALTITSMVALTTLLIPFDQGALGYARTPQILPERSDEGDVADPRPLDAPDQELWFGIDRFAVGMASLFSNGTFSGPHSLSETQPDLVQTIGWTQSTRSEVPRFAPHDSIEVVRLFKLDKVYDVAPSTGRGPQDDSYTEVPPASGMQFLAARVKLKQSAAPSRKIGHLFTLRQFRLIGELDDELTQYSGMAIEQDMNDDGTPPDVPRHLRAELKWGKPFGLAERHFTPRSDHGDEVEVVFEVPRGFRPRAVGYKLDARAPVPAQDGGDGETADARSTPSVPLPSAQPTGGSDLVPSQGARGNIRTLATRAGRSGFRDALPVTLKDYTEGANTEIRSGALVEGRLEANINEQESGRKAAVETFRVPSDKRLLQLNVANLRAGSMYGRATQFAIRNLQNYKVMDDAGNEYRICGKYAIAKVGDEWLLELQYLPNQVGSIGGVSKFQRIQDSHLKDDYDLVLLFLVEPGARIVSFTTGGSAHRADDLSHENLVAPS